MADPKELKSHFAFGQNWRSFVSDAVAEENIAEATKGLLRLFPQDELRGRRFIDVGCGSGLSMLAALRAGASSVLGVDIDPHSVQAAQQLLTHYSPQGPWTVRVASVFDLAPETDGRFDIVHSWGVLHHTGAMQEAIRKAAALVAPGGLFALALYRRTPLCGFWQDEKRLYSQSGKALQSMIRTTYQATYCAGLLATGRNPVRYIRNYKTARGMNWSHDVHDWLGGYPYESTEPREVVRLLEDLGFAMVRLFEKPAIARGLFGSHCDEFVGVRKR